jgi:hypothetical protein
VPEASWKGGRMAYKRRKGEKLSRFEKEAEQIDLGERDKMQAHKRVAVSVAAQQEVEAEVDDEEDAVRTQLQAARAAGAAQEKEDERGGGGER